MVGGLRRDIVCDRARHTFCLCVVEVFGRICPYYKGTRCIAIDFWSDSLFSSPLLDGFILGVWSSC